MAFIPGKDVLREEAYGQSGLTWADRLGVSLGRRPVMRVIRQYRMPAVLDIGCGYHATLLTDLRSMISSGVGVDVQISPAAKAQPSLTFLEQSIEEALVSLAAEEFDVITLISVLEHLRDPSIVLAGCYDRLRSRGRIIINVPNWRGKTLLELSAFKLKLSPALEMDDHKMYYDKRDLWPLLVRAGFLPSNIVMRYHKLGLNLFAVATKQ